jgi:hypothetical protein
LAQTPYFNAVTALGPAGYWPLDETNSAGSVYYVASNVGTLGDAGSGIYETWWQPNSSNGFYLTNNINHVPGVTGDADQAAAFGGFGQYVVLPRHTNGVLNSAITLQPPFTIEFWAYPNSLPSGGTVWGLVSQGRNALQGTPPSYTNQSAGVFVGMFRTNFIMDLYYGKGVTGQPELSSGTVISNTWYHVVASFDGSAASMFLNGSLVTNITMTATNSFGQNFVPDTISPFLIGCGPQYNLGRFPGYMDEVAIYSYVLSSAQVSNHYAVVSDFSYLDHILADNPVIYLRLNEGPWPVPNGSTMSDFTLPTAHNYGSAGPSANGVYQPDTAPGVQGPPFPGFGMDSRAVGINGFNSAVDVGLGVLPAVFDPTGLNQPMTITAWFQTYPADAQSRLQNVLGHGDTSWRSALDSNGLNRFNPGTGQDLSQTVASASSGGFEMNDGNWHFLACVSDGANEFLYLDGRPATNKAVVGSITGNALDIILGGDPFYTVPPGRYFDGSIAHVAYFTNALTASQLQQLYATGASISYSVFLPAGTSFIANQITAGGNTLPEVFSPPLPDGTFLTLYSRSNCSGPKTYYYDSSLGISPSNWYDETGLNPINPSNIVFATGDGAIVNNSFPGTFLTFTGLPNTPVLPLNLPCGCEYYLLSRQTNDQGTFENITGMTPQEGSRVKIWIGSGYDIFTFSGGAWTPAPPILNVGKSAFFLVTPCCSNSCIRIQGATNISVMSGTTVPVFYSPNIVDVCTNVFTVTLTPPSGTLFGLGTTPVHCLVTDDLGNEAVCDFTVTVAQQIPKGPVYSYTNSIQSGLKLIANQVNQGGNTLREIMPVVPDGSVVSKYDNNSGLWSQSTYNAALGAWVPANITLSPGEGAFFNSPTNFNLSFTGSPNVPVLPVNVPIGVAYLLSRQTNDLGFYTNIIGNNPSTSAKVYRWNGGGYTTYNFAGGFWSPSEPVIPVGESAWIAPAGGAPSAPPSPPVINNQPLSSAVPQGTPVLFTVSASGSQPLSYQWRLNGNNIAGATDSSFALPSVQPTNCGTYDVVVFNLLGATTSTNASLTIQNLLPLPFDDNFAAAGSLGAISSGIGSSSNVLATAEPGEPTPANKPGGASVWVSWMAPSTGIATFSTTGSGFDTLLGVYTGTHFSNLVAVAADDDSGGFLCSSVSFNASSGTRYLIQVDGHYAVSGNIVLNWSHETTTNKLPLILTQPRSQTAAAGATVVLSVLVDTNPAVVYQWQKNDLAIAGATNSSLTLNNLSAAQVAIYSVQITDSNSLRSVSSRKVKVQINSAGAGLAINADARAEDKFRSATDSSRVGTDDPDDPSLVTGYTGTQVFTTYGGSMDPNEPNHCGIPPCQTYWGAYQAPATGRLTINNNGTSYNAILAVYTGPNTSFSNLVPVACSSGHTPGNESVVFDAFLGTNYWVVLSGVTLPDSSCANGTTIVNYSLAAAPLFTMLPTSRTLTNGATVMLTFTVSGTPALGYQWRFNGIDIPGATTTSLPLLSFQSLNEGRYSIVVTNAGGTNIFDAALIYLNTSTRFVNESAINNTFYSTLLGSAGSNYEIQVSSNLLNWEIVRTTNGYLGIINLAEPISGYSKRYYRARRL